VIPAHPVAEALVLTLQVEAVEVGVEARRVPPCALEPLRAVQPPGVVVSVHGAELGAP